MTDSFLARMSGHTQEAFIDGKHAALGKSGDGHGFRVQIESLVEYLFRLFLAGDVLDRSHQPDRTVGLFVANHIGLRAYEAHIAARLDNSKIECDRILREDTVPQLFLDSLFVLPI